MNSSISEKEEQLRSKIQDSIRPKIKCIIFDFDGVLSSFYVRIGWPFIAAAKIVKPNLSDDKMKEVSLDVLSMLATLDKQPTKTNLIKFGFKIGKKLGMRNFQAIRFLITAAIIYSKNRKRIVPNIGARDVLRELLAQEYKVVLLTNTSTEVIDIAKEKIPELKEFDLILTRDDVKLVKPNATGFFRALSEFNLEADEVIAIGDQASDILAGKKAGVKTIAIFDRIMHFTKIHLIEQKPDFLISDIRQLPDILRFLRDCIIEDIRATIDLSEQSMQDYIVKNNINYQLGP